jgi:hypothetical protein
MDFLYPGMCMSENKGTNKHSKHEIRSQVIVGTIWHNLYIFISSYFVPNKNLPNVNIDVIRIIAIDIVTVLV